MLAGGVGFIWKAAAEELLASRSWGTRNLRAQICPETRSKHTWAGWLGAMRPIRGGIKGSGWGWSARLRARGCLHVRAGAPACPSSPLGLEVRGQPAPRSRAGGHGLSRALPEAIRDFFRTVAWRHVGLGAVPELPKGGRAPPQSPVLRELVPVPGTFPAQPAPGGCGSSAKIFFPRTWNRESNSCSAAL